MHEDQSSLRIVHPAIDVKQWLARPPSVEAVRPSRCPGCGAASHPPGLPLVLHGHGLRSREQRGPLEPGARPVSVEVFCRRYQCQRCSAVVLVAPRGVLARRLYSASAIALALSLWAVMGVSEEQVRQRTSPWIPSQRDEEGVVDHWPSLWRWSRALTRGRLFGPPAAARASPTLRGTAAQVVSWLAGHAPVRARDHGFAAQAFAGAAQLS